MNHQQAVETLASERYLLGDMTDGERDAFEAHFFECPECADDVRAGGKMAGGVRAGLSGGAQAVPIRRTWRPRAVIPWAAAASFALLAGYQTVRMRSTLDVGGPVALAPATLRPATRGQEPVVTPGPGGVVTLAVDVAATGSGGTIDYELQRADGMKVGSGQVPAPEAGTPLLLMIPSGLLKSSERYLLVTRNPRSADLTAEEYRFRVEAR